jgi:ParB family chromosome partitioning protein
MSTEKFFTYRGDVRALAAVGGVVAFVTVHPEGQPTAVYRLDAEKLTLAETPLPCGGQALLATADSLWVGGTDKRLYHLSAKGDKPAARGPQFAEAPMALAALAGNRLAVAEGARIAVLARGDGKLLQTLELPEAVTCLAADPTGQWLAAGTGKGTVVVFECETDPAQFQRSDQAALHEAAVTAILFEPDELRFLSAGADQKLLSTHARGRLEAEDRGRGANHTDPITALIAGPADRFFSGSTDSTIKSWPQARGARPVTLKEGLAKVVALAVVSVHGRPQIVVACQDNSLRFVYLDEEGKFGEPADRVNGVEAWAKSELAQPDPRRREAALRTLAGLADAASVKRIATQMSNDPDHGLRLRACQLLGESTHPHAAQALEKGLQSRDEAVRVAAFEGLRRHAGPGDLRPLTLALQAEKADIGQRAVTALEGLAAKDDQAMARLVATLEVKTPEVRRAALASLEKVHAPDSPEASLIALNGPHADVRRLALLRLFQRKLLHDPRAQAALRWRGEDADPEVRRVAYLVSLYTREKLLGALRQRDPELQRQLAELESGTLPAIEQAPAPAASPSRRGSPAPAAAPAAAGEPFPAAAQFGLPEIAATGPGSPPTDPDALAARLQELIRQGFLPPAMLEQLQQMQSRSPGLQAIFGRMVSQLEAAARLQQVGHAPGGAHGILAMIAAQIQQGLGRQQGLERQLAELEPGNVPAMEEPATRPQGPAVAERSTPAGPGDPGDLSVQLEEAVRQGLVPRQMLEKLRQLLQQNPGRVQALLDVIAARTKSAARQQPQTEEEE